MNKLTKGTIAAGAAVLLLLGTGGTLAYWNDTANIAGQTNITAGRLNVAQNVAPTWKIKHTTGTETAVTNIGAVRIVPGDQLIYSGTYTVTAEGQNLAFTVGLANGAIAAATPVTTANTNLVGRLAAATTFSVNGAPAVNAGTTVKINKTGNNTINTTPVTITATITWPFGDASAISADNDAKTGAVNLSNFALTVTQVDGTP